MGNIGMVGLVLIAANVLFSYQGFKNPSFFYQYKFEIDAIIRRKDYKRLITGAFLHVSWIHLVLNMYALYAFGNLIELNLGWFPFLVIYFASLIGGNLLALFIHRHHSMYSSVGASGAVYGIVFACISLAPGIRIFFIPSWLFGILFVAGSVYGIRSGRSNIGHDAHLGGALVGMLTTVLFAPQVLQYNLIPIISVAIPTILFLIIIATKPELLHMSISTRKTDEMQHYNIDQRYNAERNNKQQEIDRILDKINRSGADSLTEKEKETLRNHEE